MKLKFWENEQVGRFNKTIATVHLKGGVGKTTTSVMVAFELAKRMLSEGRSGQILLVDADPSNFSLTKWFNFARDQWPSNIQAARCPDPETLTRVVSEAKNTHKIIVMDVGRDNMSLVNAALHLADLCIAPVGAREMDCWEIPETVREVLSVARQHEIDLKFLITFADKRTRYPAQVRDQVTQLGLPIYETAIRPITAIIDAAGTVPKTTGDYELVVNEIIRDARTK